MDELEEEEEVVFCIVPMLIGIPNVFQVGPGMLLVGGGGGIENEFAEVDVGGLVPVQAPHFA